MRSQEIERAGVTAARSPNSVYSLLLKTLVLECCAAHSWDVGLHSNVRQLTGVQKGEKGSTFKFLKTLEYFQSLQIGLSQSLN